MKTEVRSQKSEVRMFWLRFVFLLTAVCLLPSGALRAQDVPLTNKFPTDLNTADSLGRTSDRASGALSAGINSSVDTFAITGDPASYPASGIAVVIDTEIILCTSRSSGTFSGCLRGQKGTSAAAHTSGTAVKVAILSSMRDVLVADLLELEKKIGFGSSNASSASTGFCLRKIVDGSTGWSSCPSVTSSALTKTDDTNVTVTLGGTPAASLLAPVSLTLGWTGQLAASRGGTGVNNAGTFTNASNTTVTGGGTFALGGFTFTVPGTGTAVLNTRLLTSGAGLTGGGDLGSDRNFAVGAGTGITVNADDVALDTSSTRNTDHASVTLTAGAGLTGGGDITSNRSFAVGAGNGITVNADDVALTTPGTLTVSTTNSASGNHTHAITSSSNPGAAASLLATDSSGLLTLVNLLATSNLYVRDTSTGFTSPGTTVVSPVASNAIRSTSYTSGLVGWNIAAGGNAEFNNVDVRGAIHSGLFTYNNLQATSGTLGVFKSACKLRTDAAVPSSPTYGTTTINIDCVDQDGVTHAASQLFAANDVLRLKDGVTGDTWFTVSSVSDQTTFWRYVATIKAGSNNVTYRNGAGVADYGASGAGFIIQTADQSNAPYLQMATHAATFSSADASGSLTVTPQLRIGNLNGSYGFASDTFGLGTGQYGVAGKSWVIVDPTNGVRIGNNTTTKIQLDASGNASFTGSITAASGSIGGFDVGSDYVRDAANSMGLASTVSGSDDVRFWAGNTFANRATAPFRVTESGALYATNTTITGGRIKTVVGGNAELTIDDYGIKMGTYDYGTGLPVPMSTTPTIGEFFYTAAASVTTMEADNGTGAFGRISAFNVGTSTNAGVVQIDVKPVGSGLNARGHIFLTAYNLDASLSGQLRVDSAQNAVNVHVHAGGISDLTSTIKDSLRLFHNTTGTAAAGYGNAILFQLESSTTSDRDAARIGALWTTATDASRASAVVIQTVSGAGSLTEVARFAGNGDATFTGLVKAGSGPTTLTDSTGKILSAALNTVGVAQGGSGLTTLTSNYLYRGQGTSPLAQSLIYDNGSSVGIGTSSFTSAITGTAKVRIDLGSGTFAEFTDIATGQGFVALSNGTIKGFAAHLSTDDGVVFGSFSNHKVTLRTNSANRLTIEADGGVVVGSPTGGSKGAGTLNATAVYDDNVLLTDWVFEERYREGSSPTVREGSRRLFDLAETRATTITEHRLPWMPTVSEFENARHVGGMVTRLWQGQEQQQLYIFQLEERIRALEKSVPPAFPSPAGRGQGENSRLQSGLATGPTTLSVPPAVAGGLNTPKEKQ